jgi:hypothetical protein
VGFYRLLKFLEFTTANPGQDFDDLEVEYFNPTADEPATAEDVRRPNVAAAVATGTSLAPRSSLDPSSLEQQFSNSSQMV